MSVRLRDYAAKRDFAKTPEPRPHGKSKSEEGLRFVVHKHAARRLHYDLRLELDGALKSWAVTKGPSLVLGEKRLAVHVEDHPLEYANFEGNIPEGQYGAGQVIVWDRGTWVPEGEPRKGLAKGHLTFELKGHKLKGRWHLVRLRQEPGKRQESWLLIKGDDEAARTPGDPDVLMEAPRSVLSRKTIESLSRSPEDLPPFIEPSLATLSSKAPSGGEWVHEIKFDGYRIQARKAGDRVELLTRKGLDWTERFGSLKQAFTRLVARTAIVDGELVVEGSSGASSFSALQAALKEGRDEKLRYYAFDILFRDGRDITRNTLEDRKAQLAEILSALPEDSPIRLSETFRTSGSRLLSEACRLGLEGIVSKRIGQPYRSGRNRDWLKTKCSERQEFVVVGYSPSTTSKSAVGALALGQYEKGRLVYRGRVGTGFNQKSSHMLYEELEPLRRSSTPLAEIPAGEKGRKVRWVEPKRVVEVDLRDWTDGGLIRHAVYQGLREDKPAIEVVGERTRASSKMSERTDKSLPEVDESKLTHPERLLWPDVGITKLGLAQFYAEIWPWIRPHIVSRPLSLLRCPDGADKKCFFQKHSHNSIPASVRRLKLPDEAEDMPYIDDFDGLLGLVQASVLELHPWGSTIKNVDRPDRMIFDLDPGPGVDWAGVISASRQTRQLLADCNLESFVKTTGGKGLHIVAPLKPEADWTRVKEFAESVAKALEQRNPARYTASIAKKARDHRIFVDYLRNTRGATAVAAYSTRARSGAPVSTPLSWDELSPDVGPAHFTVLNLVARLRHLNSDPWAGFDQVQQGLPKPLVPPPGRRKPGARTGARPARRLTGT